MFKPAVFYYLSDSGESTEYTVLTHIGVWVKTQTNITLSPSEI